MAGNRPAGVQSVSELKARTEAERLGVPFLLYRDGEDKQQLFYFDGNVSQASVGRRDTSDLVLDWDDQVSRLHAQFERVDSDWTVVDDGLSRNGTFVNGERVTGRRRLCDGDRVVFGETGGPLTPIQRQVLVALCRPVKLSAYGAPASNREIAAEVFLSVDAVKAHLRVLFERFGLEALPQNQKRARLAATALVNGVVAERDF